MKQTTFDIWLVRGACVTPAHDKSTAATDLVWLGWYASVWNDYVAIVVADQSYICVVMLIANSEMPAMITD